MSVAALEILRPLLNERVNDLVRRRLFDGLKFFHNGVLRTDFGRGEVKLALLVVRLANAKEWLNADELKLLEGEMRQQKVKPSKDVSEPFKGGSKSSGKKPKKRRL